MSGHSKWSQIKRQKEANDLKKGLIYTKIAKQIVLAARQGGDPEVNFSLRMALNKAKSVNMPSDSIEKAVKKGTGEDKNASVIESVTYEAYGFGGATMLIDVLTDNRNRSAADIRMIVEKHGGRIVEAGAISWQYDTLGSITMLSETAQERSARENRKWNDTNIVNKIPTTQEAIEEFELQVIDIDGVIDFSYEQEDGIFIISIYTKLEKLDAVRKAIEAIGYDIEEAAVVKKAQMEVQLPDTEKEKNERLIELLEENDDVDTVWTNSSQL